MEGNGFIENFAIALRQLEEPDLHATGNDFFLNDVLIIPYNFRMERLRVTTIQQSPMGKGLGQVTKAPLVVSSFILTLITPSDLSIKAGH